MRKSLPLRVATMWSLTVFTATIMVTPMIGMAQEKAGHSLYSRVPNPVGLTMDTRGNAYTVDRDTGYVFCIPPGADPILLAKVPDTPSAVTVDRLRTIFVGTLSGAIYSITLAGDVSEAYRCNTCPRGLSIDRDGGLLIATDDGTVIKVARGNFLWKK